MAKEDTLHLADFILGDVDVEELLFQITVRDRYDSRVKKLYLTRNDAIKISSYLQKKLNES